MSGAARGLNRCPDGTWGAQALLLAPTREELEESERVFAEYTRVRICDIQFLSLIK
jgi:hypothetical protein